MWCWKLSLDKRVYSQKLRNRFMRWVGFMPIDDFFEYTNHLVKTLSAFENFNRAVAAKLDLQECKHFIEKEDDRGMVQ